MKRYVDQSVDYGYAQTIHTAQGHTYDRVHVYVDEMISMADPPGHSATAAHLHCRPVVENRIDILVRQLSNSGIRPAAAETHTASQAMTDRELIGRRGSQVILQHG